jgi:hypothetical protein
VYCWASITLGGNVQVKVLGPVQAWVLGDIKMAGGAQVNPVPDPEKEKAATNLVLWVPGRASIEIDLLGGNVFVGCIYAPFSTADIGGNATFVGALVAASVTVRGNVSFQEYSGIAWPAGTTLDYLVEEYF